MKQKENNVETAPVEQKPVRKVKVNFAGKHVEIPASEMTSIGYEQRTSKFKVGDKVMWDGFPYRVVGVLAPFQYNHYLRSGCREFGYELEPVGKGRFRATIAEPDIRPA